ncbi:MAG: site-2 protease family protein [Clostridia bacterium]|nr:site-2 protease family protein [Clostridia bacterium]
MYVLIGILLLGILIAVHEFGHFIAARICGIEVMEFAIGMGPKLIGWTGKTGTKFSLRAIPLGGFCAFYGEDDVEGKAKDDPRAYNKQNIWKRIFTVAMGPVMNFVLAFAVALGFYCTSGMLEVLPVIESVDAGRPAAVAGMLPGDRIIGVDGVDFSNAPVTDIQAALATNGAPVSVTIRREGDAASITIPLTPEWNEEYQRYMIGITFASRTTALPFGTALDAAWDACVQAGSAVFVALKGIFTDPEIRDQVSGPVGAVAVVSQAVQQDGMLAFLNMLMAISINLGIMNLLPIPGLDGSRIIFHLIEAVRGKPIKPEREAMVHLIGMVFLFGLMIFFTFKDVIRLFS